MRARARLFSALFGALIVSPVASVALAGPAAATLSGNGGGLIYTNANGEDGSTAGIYTSAEVSGATPIPVLTAGVGLNYYQRTVPTVYATLTRPDGAEIAQDIKLRTIPVSFTARFLPLGRGGSVEPYIGAGITAIRWRFSEIGEFVDSDATIFPAAYVAEGTAVGPTVLGGLRAPVGNWVVGGEVRWQKAEASGLLNEGFLGDKLDLGGWSGNFTFGVRF